MSALPADATLLVGASGRVGTLIRRLLGRATAWFGLVIVMLFILTAVAAPLLAPYAPDTQDIAARLQGPSASHLLGTDQLGRDTLSRAIYGTRLALGIALPSVGLAVVVGLLFGILAGYVGGVVDLVIVVVLDTLQSFPAVILALTVLAVRGPSLTSVTIVIAVAFIPNYGRIARAQVLVLKEHQWVEAERSVGVGHSRLLRAHVLPNVLTPIWAVVAMDIPSAIGVEAGLSFLGLGVPPPSSSWGVLLADGFSNVNSSPWGIIAASAFLMVATLGFTTLGESIRSTLDVRSDP